VAFRGDRQIEIHRYDSAVNSFLYELKILYNKHVHSLKALQKVIDKCLRTKKLKNSTRS
jgi:hypothetical protein